ncbi:hypothetical protein DOK76_12875 [Vagococcus sp. DIV0080]|uniref:Uncharacterized protein n=1 Tax=Candidatus Vagococcus giribetii TaxID=2230876 RepID=A0ABS3HW74_9ENTE|nr:hypothetical protein [Vagococcus sp. DIV0080]MBO0477960.1 hypothetical protein [Vagococcus sp. DIV0080]
MTKQKFSSPISRLFPKKIVKYLLSETDKILLEDKTGKSLSLNELEILNQYKEELLDNKIYYEKANLNFVRKIYPMVLEKNVCKGTQFLYSEILRINPRLVTSRLGNELIMKKIVK